MGSKGFILLGLLFVLSVLCHSGYSLQCYRCLNPGGMCTNIFNCTPDSDACLSLFGEGGEGKKKERERNIHQLPLPTGDGTGNRTSGLWLCGMTLNQTTPISS
ncbi:hypothetical protein HJG60_011348 [Phyllostomus discolor]|uniref:Uncharacterized protein n=1 Tax=Phyllostomus discolor TaxID=89673 RepID=A0A833ZWP4_9CHIR|nr:hypothetical protein HJG60_011348 [Phyllostomus discolor]